MGEYRGYPILSFFRSSHLSPRLQRVARPFEEVAQMVDDLSRARGRTDPESAAGLRKLLEAKDCVVRAALDDPEA